MTFDPSQRYWPFSLFSVLSKTLFVSPHIYRDIYISIYVCYRYRIPITTSVLDSDPSTQVIQSRYCSGHGSIRDPQPGVTVMGQQPRDRPTAGAQITCAGTIIHQGYPPCSSRTPGPSLKATTCGVLVTKVWHSLPKPPCWRTQWPTIGHTGVPQKGLRVSGRNRLPEREIHAVARVRPLSRRISARRSPPHTKPPPGSEAPRALSLLSAQTLPCVVSLSVLPRMHSTPFCFYLSVWIES